MDQPHLPVDEYILAAFLAGTMSAEQRREVAAYLAEHADARELLCMAQEALDAAGEPIVYPLAESQSPTVAKPVHTPLADRQAAAPPTPIPQKRTSWSRFFIPSLLVVVLGVSLTLALWPDTDNLRGSLADGKLGVQITMPSLQFEWSEVPDAYFYKLVIFDVEDATVVANHETRDTRLNRNDPFVLSLSPLLTQGRLYQVRVDAKDAQNRLIQSSDLIDFIYQQ